MSLTLKEKIYTGLACGLVALVFGLGVGLGWKIWGPKTPKTVMEQPQAAIIHQDGAVTLAEKPNPNATPSQPQSDLPKGGVVQRVSKVVVQPYATTQPQPLPGLPSTPTQENLPDSPCPPVEIDMTTVKLPDNSHRVIVSSPSGRILDSSVDVPVEPVDVPDQPVPHNNNVLLHYDLINKVGGLEYLYHWHRVIIGADVSMVKQTMATGMPTTVSTSVVAGFSF